MRKLFVKIFLAIAPLSLIPLYMYSTESSRGSNSIISHDFGVIEPGSEHTHTFSVKNATDDTWQVEKISTTCRCTVAQVTNSTIYPGESTNVMVTYKAPSKETVESREIVLQFLNRAVPVRMRVRAKTRHTMSMEFDRIIFPKIKRDELTSKRLIVRNFGESGWRGININDMPTWLTAKSIELPRTGDHRGQLQEWAVDLTIIGSKLPQPDASARISLVASDLKSEITRREVAVLASHLNSISILPKTMTVSKVRFDETLRITVTAPEFGRQGCEPTLSLDKPAIGTFTLNEVFSGHWNLRLDLAESAPVDDYKITVRLCDETATLTVHVIE